MVLTYWRRCLTADTVAKELDSPIYELEVVRHIVIEVLPKAFGAGVGALGGLLIAGPPGAVGGYIAGTMGKEALKLVNERLCGWTVDHLKDQLVAQLEDIWHTARA